MTKTNYAENLALDTLIPTGVTRYVGLASAIVDEEAGSVTELAGTGYARQGHAFPAAAGGQKANSAELVFGPNGGESNWAQASHFFITDSAAGAGNVTYIGALVAPKTAEPGDSIRFPAGSLVCSEG